jgi:hypothetical protein
MYRPPPMTSVPFEYLRHLLAVPVLLGGEREARFVLDTGIGLTLLSGSLAAELGCPPGESVYTGRRMSGQEVAVPLATLSSLAVGRAVRERLQVGVFDVALPPELGRVDGFVGLDFFSETPFTIDHAQSAVVIESDTSLAARKAGGKVVGVRVDRDGPSVCVFLPLQIPGGASIEVEVDTGSDVALILDLGFAARVGADLEADGVRRVDAQDETGHQYTRWFTRLRGDIHPDGVPELRHVDPDVMFQRIVYDGLIGHGFLRTFAVTFDVAGSALVFAR